MKQGTKNRLNYKTKANLSPANWRIFISHIGEVCSLTNTRFFRSLLMLLLMVAGTISVCAQEDLSGTYYIGSYGKNANASNKYYLCPTEGWYYYKKINSYEETDNNNQPFLTTYKCLSTSGYDTSKAVWIIEKHETEAGCYYIKQKTEIPGRYKYIVSNGQISGTDNANRMRIHIEELDENSTALNDLGNMALFEIATYPPTTIGKETVTTDHLRIIPHDPDGRNGDNIYLVVNNGNFQNLKADGSKPNGPNGKYGKGTGGIISLYTFEQNAGWYLEDVIERPTISFTIDNKVQITGATGTTKIYYTTNGDRPTIGGSTTTEVEGATVSFDPADNVTTIKAIAIVNGEITNVTTFTPPVLLGSNHKRLIQSQANPWDTDFHFYMIPGDPDNNITKVNTTSMFRPTMEWYFESAGIENGIQYYYIVNPTTSKNLCYDATNGVHMETKTDDNKFKFSIVESSTTGSFNISPYGENKKFINKGGNNNNAASDNLGLRTENTTYSNTASAQWKFILPSTLDKTAPFTASNGSSTSYYKIENIEKSGNFIIPPTGTATFAEVTTSSEASANWYFEVAEEANANDWLTYYYIRNAKTGDYLYFSGTNNNRLEMRHERETGENAPKYQFTWARTASIDQYYIVPRLWKDLNLNKIASLRATNNATTLSVEQTRTAGYSAWEFDKSTYKCATPTITFNGSQYVISKTESDAKIKYTLDNGTTWNVYTAPFDTPSSACTIKAYVYRSGNESDKSDEATFEVTQVATPAFDYSAGNSIIITCATEGATIYYTTNGTEPSENNGTQYTQPLTDADITANTTIKAIAVKAGSITSEIVSSTVNYGCAAPIIRRGIGKTFTLECPYPTTGVTIYYTTNGTEPSEDNGTQYVSEVSFSNWGITVKAIAIAKGYSNSVVAVKTINEGLDMDGDVYLIHSAGDLGKFVTMVNNNEDGEGASAHYRLMDDVSGSGISEITTPFTGIFEAGHDANGNYYTITDLSHALFNTVNGGTVKNVMLDNVNISGGTNVGAIANEARGAARIYNCGVLATSSDVETGSTVEKDKDGYDKITKSSSTISGSNYVGSIVGLLDDEARVINCFSFADIKGGNYRGGIVGYNNEEGSNSANLKTMVMNCMYYGNIDGGNIAPIYNGYIISNRSDQSGVSNFNYFWSGASYTNSIDVYNCALSAETRYLQRFEFYRPLLNSNRELAAWWATGSLDNKEEMLKWVMEPSQIGTTTPFPILKAPGYYPSVVNIDAANAPNTTDINKGRNLGTLSVTISGVGSNAPSGAGIISSKSSLSLPITDKDPAHFNFNYYKVQLPYYNEVGTGNYTHNRVVTGWKVTVSGGTHSYSSDGSDATAAVDEDGNITLTTPYNFADRKSTGKDNFGTSGRVFSQGAYFDVPEGVTSITIEPYWAQCVYVSDPYPDVVYDQNMSTANNVQTVGTVNKQARYTNGQSYSINGDNQVVYTTMSNAAGQMPTTGSVYDNAIVLVGNVHSTDVSDKSSNKAFTIMSIDLDKDNEPDYSYILRYNSRLRVHPVRVDFVNIPGLGMAQKSTGGTGTYNFGIMQPLGWFESTNTSLFRFTQFEYDFAGRANSPMILQGGVIEQWVTVGGKEQHLKEAKSVSYYHVGGNVWFKEFHIGVHQDKTQDEFVSPHPPISITGGDFNELYLTGLYNTPNANYDDNAECYINGGRFGKVAGTGMQGIGAIGGNSKGNIIWQIDNADIDEFYAGGINAAHIAEGNLTTVISNSRVDQFCGGPKFGNMNNDKKVVTNATNCTFRAFFGAGYGGNSYNRRYPDNKNNINGNSGIGWDNWVQGQYTKKYDANYKGVETRIDYQFLPMSNNTQNVARLFVDYVSFSLATTYDVTSKLSGCTITTQPLGRLSISNDFKCLGNFYGGGSLGKVSGDVKSTLTNCTVEGSVFGAGYSATLPKVNVMNNAFQKIPYYDVNTGAYTEAILPTTEEYSWEHKETVNNTNTAINTGAHKLYTTENLNELGTVTGQVTLNIEGDNTAITGNVYGGGQSSDATGDVVVNVNGGTIGPNTQSEEENGNVYGGGQGKKTIVGGDVTVNIGTRTGTSPSFTYTGTGTIKGSVYGGSALGNVNATKGANYDYDTNPNINIEHTNGKETKVNIYAGTVNGSVFGGGKGDLASLGNEHADIEARNFGNTTVTIENSDNTKAIVNTAAYGGSNINGVLKENASVTITGGTIGTTPGENDPIADAVFGGGKGKKTLVQGNVIVNIGATNLADGAIFHGSIYGGSALGNTNASWQPGANENDAPVLTPTANSTTAVNLYKGTVKGDVYGGGLGQKEVLAHGDIKYTEDEANAYNASLTGALTTSTELTADQATALNAVQGVSKTTYVAGESPTESDANKYNATLTGAVSTETTKIPAVAEADAVEGIPSTVGGNVTVELNNGVGDDAKGCIVEGAIFGCNNANGTPLGSVTVHIYGTQYAAGDNITQKHDPNPPYYTKGRKQGEGRKVYLQRLVDAATGVVDGGLITAANNAFKTLIAASNTWASEHGGRSLMGREDGYLTYEEIAIINQYLNPSITAIENALDATKSWYDVQAVYGGGNEAEYKPTDKDGKTEVIIDGCDRSSIRYVYGGGNAAAVPATDVTVNSAKVIDYLFGGGNGERGEAYAANVGYANEEYAGTALTKLIGGTIYHAFGGSNSHGDVINGSNIEMPTPDPSKPRCKLTIKEIYGAGQNAHQSGGVKMVLGCVEGMDYVYGGAKDADIDGGVTVVITSGTFKKIFGGNNESGVIRGPIKVSIEETACDPIIIDELYLGGNLAPYSIYGYYKENDVWKPRTSATDAHAPMKKDGTTYSGEGEDVFKTYDNPILDVVSCTSIGKVFGGGYGATAIMYGSPTVNINMIKGAKAGENEVYTIPDTYQTIPNITDITTGDVANTIKCKVKDELGTIGEVYGGGSLAKVVGNTTVNIGASPKVTMESSDGMEASVEGANVIGNVYGGGQDAEVTGNTQVNICAHEVTTDNTTEWQSLSTISENITIGGSVFGAGKGADTDVKSAIVRGNSTIQMGGGWVKQNIYGGGELSCVGDFTFVTTDGDTKDDIATYTAGGTAKVNIFAGKVGPETQEKPAAYGHVYGAGKGNDSYPKFNYAQATDVTISGSAIVEGSVFGGSENGHVRGNTNVDIKGGTIGVQSIKKGGETVGNVYGGGKGSTAHFDAGIVKGKTNVTISDGIIYHNIYGGGAYGSVGTITLDDATYVPGKASVTKMPTAWGTGTGKATITITGGTIGQDGDENGMVFGSSRGDVAAPAENDVDPNDRTAWVYDTEVTIGTNNSETGPTIYGSVYGSGENGHVFTDTDIKIYSGIIGVASGEKMQDPHDNTVEYDADDYPYRGNVYGGGCGEDTYTVSSTKYYNPLAGIVLHNTNIAITGGHVVHDVFGAGALGSVGNKSTINISGGRIGVDGDNDGNVYGAARGDLNSTQTDIAHVQETEVNILPNAVAAKSPVIWNNVFGGGQAGIVKGSVAVNVTGGEVKNDVYGGGALADTNTDNWDATKASYAYDVVTGLTVHQDSPVVTGDNVSTYYTKSGRTYSPASGEAQSGVTYYSRRAITGDFKTTPPIDGTSYYTTTVSLTGGKVGNAYGGGLGQWGTGVHYTPTECNTYNATLTGHKAAGETLTAEEAAAYNVQLTGAIASGAKLTSAQATAVNTALSLTGGDAYATDGTAVISAAHATAYNATLTGALSTATLSADNANAYNATLEGARTTSDWKVHPSDDTGNVKAMVYGDVTVTVNEKDNDTYGTARFTIDSDEHSYQKKVRNAQNIEQTVTEKGTVYTKGRVFGCNNINGTPKGDVTVTVRKTLPQEGDTHIYTEDGGSYEIQGVYGGGNLANYEPATGKQTTVNIRGCGETSIQYVFGGGNAARVPETHVNIFGTFEIESVFGGGNGNEPICYSEETWVQSPGAEVMGDTNVRLMAGLMHQAFGGSFEKGTIYGQTNIDKNNEGGEGCTLKITDVFGGGKDADVNSVNIVLSECNMTGLQGVGAGTGEGQQIENVYAGSYNARILGDVTMTVTSGIFKNVFGGNYSGGFINGQITLNVEETASCKPVRITNLYGGGNYAPYPGAGANNNNPKITINVKACTSIGNIYGGSFHADVNGDTEININMIKGWWADKYYPRDSTNPNDLIPNTIGTIGNVYGGGNEGRIVGNTVVNIGNLTEIDLVTKPEEDANNNNQVPAQFTKNSNNKYDVLGAHITGNVYGGGNKAEVTGNTYVNISSLMTPEANSNPTTYTYTKVNHANTTGFEGLSIGGSVYGGGNKADIKKNTNVRMSDGYVFNGIFGGGYAGSVGTFERAYDGDDVKVHGHTPHEGCIGKPISCAAGTGKCTVVVDGGQIGPIEVAEEDKGMNRSVADGGPIPQGWVWGAGQGIIDDPATHPDTHFTSYVGSTDVTIGGTALIMESIIGGGEFGRVLGNTLVKIQDHCQIGIGEGMVDANKKPIRYTDGYDYGNGTTTNQFVNPLTTPITEANALKECSHFPYGTDTDNDEKPDKFLPYDPFYDKYLAKDPSLASSGFAPASTSNPSDGSTWIGCVFGGGSGYMPYEKEDGSGYDWSSSAGWVEGNTEVQISGGHILTNVYGGNEYTNIKGKSIVKMTGGTIGVPRTLDQIKKHPLTCYLFGAGKGDQRTHFNTWTNVQETEVEVTGGIIYGSVFGGGEDGHVLGNASVTIGEGAIIGTEGKSYVDGNVFGGGRGFSGVALTAGSTGGNVTLNITGGTMLGSVYGGGRLASVGIGFTPPEDINYGQLIDDEDENGDGQMSAAELKHGHITINISGGTIGNRTTEAGAGHPVSGNVFGGSMGRLTLLDDKTRIPLWPKLAVVKETTVNIKPNADDTKSPEIWNSVYGGSEFGIVRNRATVNVEGGTIHGNVYGGGYGSDEEDKMTISAGGYDDIPTVYYTFTPMIWTGCVSGDTYVNISGGKVEKNVYGGGNFASVGLMNYNSNEDGTVYNYITKHDITNGFGLSWPYKFEYIQAAPKDDAPGGKKIGGKTTVNITGGRIGTTAAAGYGNVYGGSKGMVSFKKEDNETPITDVNEQRDAEAFCANVRETAVTVNYGSTPESDDGSTTACIVGAVYGGGQDGHVYEDANVTITKGLIGLSVYGGGQGESTFDGYLRDQSTKDWKTTLEPIHSITAGKVYGNTSVSMTGGHVVGHVYGGGNLASVGKGNYAGGSDDYYPDGYGEKISTALWTPSAGFKPDAPITDSNKPTTMADYFLSSGKVTVSITGGKVGTLNGTSGTEFGTSEVTPTGLVFGGSRGRAAQDVMLNPRHEYAPDFYLGYVNKTTVNIGDANGGPRIFSQVFGGGRDGHVRNSAHVTVNNGTIGQTYAETEGVSGSTKDYQLYHRGNVYGSGSGLGDWNTNPDVVSHGMSSGSVTNSTTVDINGGTIYNNVYGGGALSSVGPPRLDTTKDYAVASISKCTVNINGGTIGQTADYESNKYGGCVYGASRGNDFATGESPENYATVLWTEVNINGGNIAGNVYGGAKGGLVWKDTEVNLKGGTIAHNAYGGGQGTTDIAANVDGNTTVVLNKEKGANDSGCIVEKIFGCNDLNGTPKGHALVHVYATQHKGTDKIVPTGGKYKKFDKLSNYTIDNYATYTYQDKTLSQLATAAGIDTDAAPYTTYTGILSGSGTEAEKKEALANLIELIADKKYDVLAVYGGGDLAMYKPYGPQANNTEADYKATTQNTEVIIEGCDLTSIKQVYGGGNAASVPATNLTINSAYEIFEVFGGGNGNDDYYLDGKHYLNPGANVGFKNYTHFVKEGTSPNEYYNPVENTTEDQGGDATTKEHREANYGYGTGIATTNARGGTIHTVYGGSNKKGNIRTTAMSAYESSDDSCPLCIGETYGAGKEAPMDGNIDLTLDCVKDMPVIYGGAKDADVNADITLNITNGTFEKVFGGNNTSGAITGSITVNVEEKGCQPIFIKELYGGGYLAPYSIYGYDKDDNGNYVTETINGIVQRKPLTSGDHPQKNPRINIISATRIDNIYGGGYQAKVVGSPRINVNMQEGTILAKYMDDEENFVGEHTDNDGNKYIGKELGEEVTLDDETKRHTGILAIGKIGNIYGGGNQADIVGDTYIEIGTGKWINANGEEETMGTDKKTYIYNVDKYTNDKNKWGYETTTTTGGENPVTTTTFTPVDNKPAPLRNAAEITGIVYGGGNEGDVTSNTYITMENGSVYNRIYGGGNKGNVGTITSSITPAGHTHEGTCIQKPDTWKDDTGVCNVTVSGGRVGPLNIAMPDDYGHVFGAGRGETKDPAEDPDIDFEAYVKETNVTIEGTALICGGVYGGSENGRVRGDTHVYIKGGQIGVGEGAEGAYDEDKFINPIETPVTAENALAECAHWDYKEPFKPYDEVGATEGGATTGSDGHSFYGNVFGGGSGYYPYKKSDNSYEWLPSAGLVEGNTNVEVTGGHILNNLYGGNEMSDVTGTCNVTMTGGTLGVPRTLEQIKNQPVCCYLFGAGKGDQRTHFNTSTNVGNANITVGGNTIIYGSVFGGGEDGHVLEDIKIEIQDGNNTFTVGTGENAKTYHFPIIGTTGTSYVDGNIFGAGRGYSGEALTAGSVGGNINVDIKGGTMLGSIYGGGRLASVGTNFAAPNDPLYGSFKEDVLYEEGDVIPEGKKVGDIKTSYGHVTVNISGGTIGNDVPDAKYGGNVFGGSMGRLELLNGTPNPLWPQLAQVKTTAVNISGNAHIKRSVYGGGEMGTVRDDAIIDISGKNAEGLVVMDESPTIEYNVFGGGYGSEIDYDTYQATIQTGSGETAKTYTFRPIEYAGCVGGDTHVDIRGGLVKRTVYGGGEKATVGLVDLEKTKSQEHQGSGFELSWPYEYAFIQEKGGTAHVNITGGRIGLSGKDKINSDVEEDNGDIYGGGKGKAGNRYRMGFCGNVRNSVVNIDVPTPTNNQIEIYDRTGSNKWTLRLKKQEATENKLPGIAGSVYGGGEDGHVLENATIYIRNGYIGHSVYGGGKGKGSYMDTDVGREIPCNTAGKVYGNTTIEMTGGWIMRNIYGGGNLGSVGKGNYAGGSDDYYPNGYGEKTTGKLWEITKDSENKDIHDDAWHFLNSGIATVNIYGGKVGYMVSESDKAKISVCDKDDLPTGNVFGGCRGQAATEESMPTYEENPDFFLGYVNKTEVNIGRTNATTGPTIYGSVYGGGQDGHVRYQTSVTINKGEIGIPYNDDNIAIIGDNLDDMHWLNRGNVYGAGSGIGTYNSNNKDENDKPIQKHSSSSGSITRSTNVTVNSGITGETGGVIYRNVYGGGSLASVGPPLIGTTECATKEQSLCSVTIDGAVGSTDENIFVKEYGGEVYGASRGETLDPTLYNNFADFASVIWTKVLVKKNAVIMGNVFGGGDDGIVRKDSEVIVGE